MKNSSIIPHPPPLLFNPTNKPSPVSNTKNNSSNPNSKPSPNKINNSTLK